MKKLNFLFIISIVVVMIGACKKKDNSGSEPGMATYSVRMTDAPGPYQEVNIDVRGVEITGSGGKTTLLNVTAGIYNLLDFSNGLDTLIATGPIQAGRVEQIRLILGPNNTVVIGGDAYLLDVPSGEQSGLKLQVHQDVQAGVAYSILLDFDAHKSIVETGSGKYKLKPVIRTVSQALGGSIRGNITPAGVSAVVTATDGVNSYSTVVNSDGYFMLMSIPPGTYDITVTPVAPYNVVIKTGVLVNVGSSIDIGVLSIL